MESYNDFQIVTILIVLCWNLEHFHKNGKSIRSSRNALQAYVGSNLVCRVGVLTTADYQWPCRLCHMALRFHWSEYSNKVREFSHLDAFTALKTFTVQTKQITNGEKRICNPLPICASVLHTATSDSGIAETLCAKRKISSSLLFECGSPRFQW